METTPFRIVPSGTLVLLFLLLFGNTIYSQSKINVYDLKPEKGLENIQVRKIASDSLSSTFIIWIVKEVKAHKHEFHSENLLMLEGSGTLTLDGEKLELNSGDFAFIPKNSVHSFTTKSVIPAKVLSVQSPEFKGADRVFVE